MSKKDSWKNKYGVVKNGVLKSFTVYEDKWDTGNVGVLSGDRGRCCIGFLALACGVEEKEIIEKAIVNDLKEEDQLKCLEEEELQTGDGFEFAYEVNDMAEGSGIRILGGRYLGSKKKMTQPLRKKLLKDFFKKEFNVNVVFKPKEPK